MAQSTEFVTREEFDSMKVEEEKLSIRVEVLTDAVTSLTRDVADLRQETNERFLTVDERFDRLEKLVMDGNAALMSAILKLGNR